MFRYLLQTTTKEKVSFCSSKEGEGREGDVKDFRDVREIIQIDYYEKELTRYGDLLWTSCHKK